MSDRSPHGDGSEHTHPANMTSTDCPECLRDGAIAMALNCCTCTPDEYGHLPSCEAPARALALRMEALRGEILKLHEVNRRLASWIEENCEGVQVYAETGLVVS